MPNKSIAFLPFIMSLAFVATGVAGLYRGIENHETLRIILASLGIAVFSFFAVLMGVKLFKPGKIT